jgi:hypothetical protein
MNKLVKIFAGCLGVMTVATPRASVIFTIEGPGVQQTSVAGVTTETFNSGSPGGFNGAVAMGTFSSGGAKVAADQYGGANGSQYYAVGVQSGALQSTLTMTTPQNYVGMWWSAGDVQNHLEFYNGATLVGSFAVGDIIPSLNSSYYGNPNSGLDSSEPFVYLNFTATGSDSITSVKFKSDTLGAGFEIDNLSVTTERIEPPGHGVPDGGSTAALLAGGLALLRGVRRKLAS